MREHRQHHRRYHQHHYPNCDTVSPERHRNSKILAGFFVILFGVLFLLERQGMQIPEWVISWKTFMIAFGIVQLYKHKFRTFFGWALIAVGGLLLTNEFRPDTVDKEIILPIIVILIGVSMIVRHTNLFGSKKKVSQTTLFDDEREISSEDFIKSSTFFGGVTKNVVSKNFKGAELTTAFGGTEINLTKADIEQPITINATTMFGGVTLIVPSHWQVHSDITTIAGSVEDQRSLPSDVSYDPSKTVTLTGTCLFGGVEIRSYA